MGGVLLEEVRRVRQEGTSTAENAGGSERALGKFRVGMCNLDLGYHRRVDRRVEGLFLWPVQRQEA